MTKIIELMPNIFVEIISVTSLIDGSSVVSGIVSGIIVSASISLYRIIRRRRRRTEQIRFIREIICEGRDMVFRYDRPILLSTRLLFFQGMYDRIRLAVDRRCSDVPYEHVATLERILTKGLSEARSEKEKVVIFFQIVEDDTLDHISFLKIPKWQGPDQVKILDKCS